MSIERFKTILLLAVLMLFMVPQSAWATYRAVATNSKLPGAFSVGATKQVWFSQGNLQYQADNGDGGSTWRFAINQYDFVGDATHGNVYLGETKCDNANISSTYTDWIDLFGWATSGNSASGTAYQPWSISTTNSYYGPAISSGEWTAANSDWGVVNVAQLGSGWRTLTHDEWVYLINTRTNASSLRTFATVNGVVGLILMPDGWTTSGVSLTITTANYTSNDISLAQWNKLEEQGCVFLPSDGYRGGDNNTTCDLVQDHGSYWSSTAYNLQHAYYLDVKTGGLDPSYENNRRIGLSVRLVSETMFPGSGTADDPYLITSVDTWNYLANAGNTYDGKYFRLTKDITVTTMVTATFSGTFDGGGHTLTFNYTATGDNAAPFAYITGATIRNLHTTGTINTASKFAAGIVAISNGGTITNCQSSVTINSSTSGDGTHGGLVADSYQGTLDISNCLFDGKMLGTNTHACGGIVGWHKQGTLNISNTLFAPAEMTIQTTGGAIFARNGFSKLTNCYYISDWAAATMQGTNAGSMTKPELVAALNNGDKHWCIHRSSAIPIMVNLVINNASEWNSFASNVSDYNDKYVKLNADISVTTIATGSFTGIFDGNGHTMTVNISPASGNEAAFRYLNNGTIMNLNVTGTVTAGSNYASGLVARTSGGDCLIDNCIVNTNVAGSGWAGGIVAHGDNATKLTITNCIYGGTITQSGGYIGGILGWYNNTNTLDLVMTNCLFKGDYTGNGQFHPIGVKKWDGIFKSINCTNCYYTKNPANIDDAKRTFTSGTKVSALTIGTTGVSIASGSYATFQGTKYYYGTVTLGYNGPMATTNFSLDGTHLNDNSFTISKDNAAFDDGSATIKWDFPGRGTVDDPYQISSAAVWDFLADQVNAGTNYSGKYFQQTGDFTVSSKIIGYPTDDTHYVTFNGIYDGNGCTITASISKSDERYVAPFHCIANATIKNVIVTGSVTVSGSASIEHRRYPAGLVGVTDGTCILQNCRVSANVSGCDYMGGLIGHTQNANITITGCVYSGILTASDSNNTGGLIGWGGDNGGNNYALSNNLFAGSYSGSGKFHPVGFLYNPTGNTRTVTNTYYMTGLRNVGDDDGNSLVKGLANKGKFAYSITSGSDVTVAAAGEPTATYNVSKLDFFGTNGFALNGALYGGQGDVVSLSLGYTPQSGYSFHSFTASAGTLTGSSNPYTLTMADADATINVRYSTTKSITATPSASAASGWYLIASPFVSVTPSEENGFLTNNYDLFRFNQSAEMEWQNYQIHHNATENPFNALVSGQGYLYANSQDVDLTFIGTPYNGTGIVSLNYSTANPDPRMYGWNLIGNPFGVTATIARDCYKMKASHDEVILCESPATIDPMEGVFVQATAENQSVTFSTGAKRETAGSEDCIVINLSGSKGTIIDRAIVSFDNGRTLPKFQIKGNSTKLYIPQKGTDYAIAFAYRIGELPLNFKAQETGVYTLNFNGDNMTAVSLVDMIEGAIIDLSVNDTYTFIGSPNDREDRFKLVFSSPNDSNIDIFAYQTGNEIVVSGEGELQVFDVMGRLMMQHRIYGVQTVAKPNQTGVYILRLNEKSQKIVVR